jgi:hypothetical protein
MAIKTILGKENENDLKKYQKILLNQAERLDDNEIMKEQGKREIARSGALSQNATAFVKSIQTQLKIVEVSSKYNVEPDTMNDYLGIKSDK